MPFHCRAPASRQHLQAFLQLLVHTPYAQGIDLGRRQFQGQGNTVEAPANIAQWRQILGTQHKALLTGTHPCDK